MLDYQKISELTDEVEALAKIDRVLRNEHCHRCGGLMIQDHCLDVQSDSGEVDVKVLRCCACGELIDPTILRNRIGVPHLLNTSVRQPLDRSTTHEGPAIKDKLTSEILKTWSDAVIRKSK